jgi:rhamnose transport system substrate-binding protein
MYAYLLANRRSVEALSLVASKWLVKDSGTYENGRGTPNEMKEFVADGSMKSFVLWNLASLGCFAAVELASGKITGVQGQTPTAGRLSSFTVGEGNTIVLGPSLRFSASSIGQFDF